MQCHPLGRTGIKVSPSCLGAMVFGAMDNPDRGETIRMKSQCLQMASMVEVASDCPRKSRRPCQAACCMSPTQKTALPVQRFHHTQSRSLPGRHDRADC